MLLIIDKSKSGATHIADMFHYMGFLAYAAEPEEALSELSSLYRCAVIINPDTLPDVFDFVKRIRAYSSTLPIFAVNDGICKSALLFERVFSYSIYSSTLAEGIIDACKSKGSSVIGRYRLMGIDASAGISSVKYFDSEIPLTKTESMILRFLIRSYPTPRRAADILKYAFRPSRCPEPSSVRTHISVMNKKFRALSGKNLFTSFGSDGYSVLTPEIEFSVK